MAPNVVTILFDDLGFAQLGCFGGAAIDTPNIDRLAAGGLRYNRFHVTALCSPTRASLLTGRNHHAVGVGFLVDVPFDDPGYRARIPATAATLPRILRDNGYSTMAVGKWHLTPIGERSHAGPFSTWPLGLGFESYYGCLQGGTNQWVPNLVRDNHYVDPPSTPDDGYHFTEDITDEAIRSVVSRLQAAPGKPFYLHVAPVATHSPHHVAKEWSERYAGVFDEGWDVWRQRTFDRQIELGIVPEGTTLPERPPWVRAWDDLDHDAKKLFARMQEVYAGLVSHTDAQIGRLIDALDEHGVLDDTIVMVMSDNGASAEGGEIGTFNEHRFSQQVAETVADNMPHYDDWGGHRTYSHYAWGWAWAGNTPFRLWKRYTWLGGTRTPLVVHWPAGIADRGAVRDQFCHVADLMPTILDACGIEPPAVIDGVEQQRIDGASLRDTFADDDAPSPRDAQYFEMLGSRSMVVGDWKATTDHVSTGVADEDRLLTGSRDFATDEWALFDLAADFAEAHDVAADHPDVVADLIARWDAEAEANDVLPLADSLVDRLDRLVLPPYPPANPSVFRPGGPPIVDESVPRLSNGGTMTARVIVPDEPEGVLFALGDWNSGYALFVTDRRAHLAMVVGGTALELAAPEPLRPGHATIGFTATPGPDGTRLGLQVDGATVATATTPYALPYAWQHGGTHLRLGHDTGFPVTDTYTPPHPWNGELIDVVVDASPAGPRPEDVADALHAE